MLSITMVTIIVVSERSINPIGDLSNRIEKVRLRELVWEGRLSGVLIGHG
jgi:hypothetical protein